MSEGSSSEVGVELPNSGEFKVAPLGAITPELLSQLRGVSIFASLREEDFDCLIGAEEMDLAPGDVLLRQGEFVQHFLILLEGKIGIFQTNVKQSGKQIETEVSSYSGGSAFGELPLLANLPVSGTVRAMQPSHVLRLNEESFWHLMTACPEVRRAILGNMAQRFQKYQSTTLHQEKMAALGTLAAGLMHELNNPGAAARRAASQLRQNLQRMQELSTRLSRTTLNEDQKECLYELQVHAMETHKPLRMNSLEQSDAEEELATWMEEAHIENAWKLAPTLVSVGLAASDLECAKSEFETDLFSDCLSWLEALVSSMQLVGMIEESIGRVTELVHAVKSYAYEGKGLKQSINVNDSVHATLVILGHKMREKEITVEKAFNESLPLLQTDLSGLNQVWTNLLDNAIDALEPKGKIKVKTWTEDRFGVPHILVSIADTGAGIPIDIQPHIFDLFYTTKEVGVGTGLGLGIVGRIVEQFGGTIRFSSEPGWTEFVVSLPSARPGRST
jgi:signal transduction histidine kinase